MKKIILFIFVSVLSALAILFLYKKETFSPATAVKNETDSDDGILPSLHNIANHLTLTSSEETSTEEGIFQESANPTQPSASEGTVIFLDMNELNKNLPEKEESKKQEPPPDKNITTISLITVPKDFKNIENMTIKSETVAEKKPQEKPRLKPIKPFIDFSEKKRRIYIGDDVGISGKGNMPANKAKGNIPPGAYMRCKSGCPLPKGAVIIDKVPKGAKVIEYDCGK